MANTTLTQTGAQVQAAINKAEKLPTVTGSDSGKILQVDSSGNFAANTPTTYSSLPPSSGGTDVSLVTTGDKYNWNNKLNVSSFQGTDSVATSLYGGNSIIFNIAGGEILYIGRVDQFGTGHTEIECLSDGRRWVNNSAYSGSFNAFMVDANREDYVTNGLPYLTIAPSANNPENNIKIVVLSSEPATKYDGYLYIITGA